jgi:sugar phosphate isomerase/epimerase
MRLGGPVFEKYSSPEEWVAAVRRLGYRAAYCPVGTNASPAEIRDYEQAARRADIVIAEVGAWCNPLSPDAAERSAALEKCQAGLRLADEIGARCCVNIAGSRGSKWDGPDPRDLTAETFERIVDVVREIIDSVRPRRAFYTLEPMPWMYPDSVESYQELIAAIDRPCFAVHFDPVNWVNSPGRYFCNGDLIRQAIAALGGRIRSCHAKDIALRDRLTVHLDEVRPGLGGLDYPTFLTELARLDPDMPLMLEHLPGEAEYTAAAAHVRLVAEETRIIV